MVLTVLSNSHLRTVAIVQARMGSTRMPGKVLELAEGKTLLAHLFERLSRAASIDEIVLAIPTTSINDILETEGWALGAKVFRGSELDVLGRYASAASLYKGDLVVRITADCPLIDPAVVDYAVSVLVESRFNFVGTGLSYPDGTDVEVFSSALLFEANENARENYDREHVTPYMKNNPNISVKFIERSDEISGLRLTVDNPEDLEVVRGVLSSFGHNHFSLNDIGNLAEENPALFESNRHYERDEGSRIGNGAKLWRRALKVIPSGNMMVSKNPSILNRGGSWPTYFSRAKGHRIWDLDGKVFEDFGLMGVGTSILGYGDEKVDAVVADVVANGNLSSLNCPEEVYLSERLVALHPWSDMVKLARTGGEACAIAVRLARLASGKSGVAFCGYHGWHDWYLSANLGDPNALSGHHLPGLGASGIPDGLRDTSHVFGYNKAEELEELLSRGEIGVVVMEVERNESPVPGFLAQVRELASKFGAVLVFDESTSGFRKRLGGLHLDYGVNPDLLVLGKTLGNGFAITAVVGSENVMSHASRTFLSSTFWSERVGPAAGVATLERMEELDAPARVNQIGLQVREIWADIARTLSLDLRVRGIPAIQVFSIEGVADEVLKQAITGAMLEKGYLAGNYFYASIAHGSVELERYRDALWMVLSQLREAKFFS